MKIGKIVNEEIKYLSLREKYDKLLSNKNLFILIISILGLSIITDVSLIHNAWNYPGASVLIWEIVFLFI